MHRGKVKGGGRGAVAFLSIAALVSSWSLFADTLAYWQLDEVSGSTVLQDAIGAFDLDSLVAAAETEAFFSSVPNPDAGPFSIGTPQENPSALRNSHGGRSGYDVALDMRSTPWTLEGWFHNAAETEMQSGVEMIALTRHASSGYRGWDLRMNNGVLQFCATANDGAFASVATPLRYDDGRWHHVAVQWDPETGSDGTICIFVDGVLSASGAGVGDLGDDSAYAKRFAFGHQFNSAGTGVQFVWNGDLDEFRFSDVLLDPSGFLCAEISVTRAYWQLDEATGVSVIGDVVGSNDLSLAVSTVQISSDASLESIPNPDRGPFLTGDPQNNPAALQNSHAAQAVYDASLDMRDAGWTLEGWFRNAADVGTQTGAEILAATRNASAGWKGWDLRMQNGRLQLLAAADSGSTKSVLSGERFDDGAWHHVAIVWDPDTGSGGWMQLYVDGDLAVEGPGVGDLGESALLKRFAIGAQIDADGTVRNPWNGDLDEFRFSDALQGPSEFLSAGEISPDDGPVVSNLTAVCRNGQVFVQWDEASGNADNLRVYMYTNPITAGNFEEATLVEPRIEPHSANDWYDDPAECPGTSGPVHGWVIEDGGVPLDRNDGLFVHTVVSNDPECAYFAVLADGQVAGDLEDGLNTTTQAIALAIAPVQPIWQLGNTTENRPVNTELPLSLYLHYHTGRPSGTLSYLVFGDKTMGWREGLPFKFKVSILSDTVLVEPYDRVWINRRMTSAETVDSYNTQYKNIETWHYGTNDKIYDAGQRESGVAVNYTERLHLWILDWVEQAYGVDANRVYAYGQSMGTGAQRLVMQNPDRFASVDLMVPFVDWSYVDGTQSNAKRMDACCGPMAMMTSDGVTLGERMNLVSFMQKTSRDLPHVTIRVGRTDGSVYWAQKPPYMAAMQFNRHGLAAGWDNGGHGDAMRYIIEAFPEFRDYKYAIDHFALNKSYPAFSNFSLNEDPGNGDPADGDLAGFINRGLEWSEIVDQSDRYEIKIQVTHPDAVCPETVDVTLRNRQKFLPAPGQAVRVENRNKTGELVEEKTVVVDEEGRITCEGFSIDSAEGNTLVITGAAGFLFLLLSK